MGNGFEVWGLGVGDWDSQIYSGMGFEVWGLELGNWGFGIRSLGFRVWDLGARV